jgi:hypothetical protein
MSQHQAKIRQIHRQPQALGGRQLCHFHFVLAAELFAEP